MMKIFVNDAEVSVAEGVTVSAVLEAVEIPVDRRGIAVAVNDHVVRRQQWEVCAVSPGDRVEIIQATQGG